MKKLLILLASFALFILAFIWALPASIDDDLTKIGNGKKSVVFIYDLNLVVSNQQTTEINKIQTQLKDKVNFLVARTGYPKTDELIQEHRAEVTELLFFDENGHIYSRKFALVKSENLKLLLAEPSHFDDKENL